MIKKTLKENPDLYILLVNAPAVLYILIAENLPQKFRFFLIGMFLAVCILGLLPLWKKIGFFTFFRNLQLSILCFILLVGLTQFLYILSPSVYPKYITNLIETTAQKEMKGRVVELLDHSPFAKPKPNVLIHVPGDYGSETDFEYEWRTDGRGYKNNPEIAIKDQFDVIALGDSFTEGLGVKTDDTWVSQLNVSGITAYSLGVQGYAPSQMNGTFQFFGARLNPQLVIIGYLTSTYDREALLLGSEEEIVKEKSLPSAIGRLVNKEYRSQFKLVATATLFIALDQTIDMYQSYIDPRYKNDPRFIPERLMVADETISIGKMQRYKKEMQNAIDAISTRGKIESSQEWGKTIAAFKEIAAKAKTQGADTMLLIFHNRGPIYLNRATGGNLSENYQGYIESELLGEFALGNGLFFLDTEMALVGYVAGIDEATDISEYPYLKYDGHFSGKGNEIIANLVVDFIRANALLPPNK